MFLNSYIYIYIYHGLCANNHQLKRYIFKFRIDKSFLNKGYIYHYSRESCTLKYVLMHNYISKVVNDRWLMGIPIIIDILNVYVMIHFVIKINDYK